jgi:hypothetical protein
VRRGIGILPIRQFAGATGVGDGSSAVAKLRVGAGGQQSGALPINGRIAGSQFDAAREILHRQVVALARSLQSAAPFVCGGKFRRQLDCLAQVGDGQAPLPADGMHRTAIVVRLRIVGRQFDGAVEVQQRTVEFVELQADAAPAVEHFRIPARQGDRAVEVRHGQEFVALRRVNFATHEIGVGVVRKSLDGLGKIGDRPLRLAQLCVSLAARRVGPRHLGLERERA